MSGAIKDEWEIRLRHLIGRSEVNIKNKHHNLVKFSCMSENVLILIISHQSSFNNLAKSTVKIK